MVTRFILIALCMAAAACGTGSYIDLTAPEPVDSEQQGPPADIPSAPQGTEVLNPKKPPSGIGFDPQNFQPICVKQNRYICLSLPSEWMEASFLDLTEGLAFLSTEHRVKIFSLSDELINLDIGFIRLSGDHWSDLSFLSELHRGAQVQQEEIIRNFDEDSYQVIRLKRYMTADAIYFYFLNAPYVYWARVERPSSYWAQDELELFTQKIATVLTSVTITAMPIIQEHNLNPSKIFLQGATPVENY